ncbi:ComEA family DNA-binding protein [Thalassobacillus devorans]|uniref:ComEA family DNA-binding protein n=1 Tax=Thalassobacillus devorans TaxID=279813 RepID=UPI00048ADF69|nr:ComEA family DNA-binding protein [Thalassobacillus devorans]
MYWIKKYAWMAMVGAIIIWILVAEEKEKEDDVAASFPLEETSGQTDESNPLAEQDKIVVDVKGAVLKPGVYELSAGSRVADAIEMAGGMRKEADPTSVNLAQRLIDEMMIIVNSYGNTEEGSIESDVKDDKIRINYADVEEIQQLDGIGESKAKAIVQHREENGLFQTMDDLLDVSGIGEKTLENIGDSIQIP